MEKNFKTLIYHLFMSGIDLEPLSGGNLGSDCRCYEASAEWLS